MKFCEILKHFQYARSDCEELVAGSDCQTETETWGGGWGVGSKHTLLTAK